MSNRKVFYHVLAEDVQVGDTVLIEKPSASGSGVFYRHLITVTDVYESYGQYMIEGRDKEYDLFKVLYEEDQLVPVVQ